MGADDWRRQANGGGGLMVFAPLGLRPRRKRKERPPKTCMTPGCGMLLAQRWKWLCDGCFRQLPFPRRKAIAEACQARESQRVFGLCRDAAEWVASQREKRVEA